MKKDRELFNRNVLDEIMKNYSIDKLVDFFRPNYSKTFSMDVGVWEGYSLEEHIKMVLNQFDKYFSHKTLHGGVSNTFFRVLIILHDIGKPAAVKEGDIHLQHEKTLKLIKPIFKKLDFNDGEIKIALALIDGDYIGSYLKGGSLEKSIVNIKKMSETTNLPLKQLFSLLTIYYQCDAGSYTEDSGGKKSLDHLFIFNHKNRTLKFSRDLQSRFNILENSLFSQKKNKDKKEDLWKGKFKQKNVLEAKIKVMDPFIEKYGHPVIVHAAEDVNTFRKILESGRIGLPKSHGNQKKTPLMEKILGVDNSVFLSVGFDYWVNYDFKFNLVFDWGMLSESDYYWRPLPFKCYTDIMNWWYKNDRGYLYKLRCCNKITEEVVGRYLWGKESGDPLAFFEYWKMEKIVFDFIVKYPKKKILIDIAKKRMGNLKRTYPYSKVLAKRDWKTNRCPEIIHHKEIDLFKSPYFLGFFIEGKIPKSVEKILKEKYKGKIIFDGKKFGVLV